jgi:hypothetical protein
MEHVWQMCYIRLAWCYIQILSFQRRCAWRCHSYELSTPAVEDTTLSCKVAPHVPNDAVSVQDKWNALYSILQCVLKYVPFRVSSKLFCADKWELSECIYLVHDGGEDKSYWKNLLKALKSKKKK